jgi:excisionase family DNA binding protein
MFNERHMRVEEFAKRTGYKIPTIRKKLLRREIIYRKVGRIVIIPESELDRLLGDLRPAILGGVLQREGEQ